VTLKRPLKHVKDIKSMKIRVISSE